MCHIGILNLRSKHGTPKNKASRVPNQSTAGIDVLNEAAMAYSYSTKSKNMQFMTFYEPIGPDKVINCIFSLEVE